MTASRTRPASGTTTSSGNELIWDRVRLPIGGIELDLLLLGDGEALTGLLFDAADNSAITNSRAHDPKALAEATEQLHDYAAGRLSEFDLPLRPAGSPFQRAVWARLAEIPYGTTTTYGKIAREVGRPKGSRAVGAAVGSNPIPIILPCHRVIGADGSLTGFGGGLDTKVALLGHEGIPWR